MKRLEYLMENKLLNEYESLHYAKILQLNKLKPHFPKFIPSNEYGIIDFSNSGSHFLLF